MVLTFRRHFSSDATTISVSLSWLCETRSKQKEVRSSNVTEYQVGLFVLSISMFGSGLKHGAIRMWNKHLDVGAVTKLGEESAPFVTSQMCHF